MRLKAFAVYDGKIGAFMRPFFDAHLGSALRSFEEACTEPTSPFAKHASDFVLYQVGEFEDEKGLLVPCTPPVQLSTALEVSLRRSAPVGVSNA